MVENGRPSPEAGAPTASMPTMLSAATSNRMRSRTADSFPAGPDWFWARTPTSETSNKSLFGAAALGCDHRARGGSGGGAVGGLADRAGDAAAGGRGDVVGEAQPRDLREAAGHGGHLRDPVFEHG